MTQNRLSLHHAALDWDQETPVSRIWNDVYFNKGNGMNESRAVFLDGSGLSQLWHDRPHLTIGETGFGTGLNFLTLWRTWKDEKATARIHFISTEIAPMLPADMARALAPYRELDPLASELLAQWPPAFPGLHSLSFENGKITLILCFGDAATMLSRLEARMDAWFLDGFSPAKNPAMWQPALYAELARLSAKGARLATFTAAGHVRRGLEAVGFVMEKHPGFNGKRERLAGRYEGGKTRKRPDMPWFSLPPATGGPVAIIGDGIAAHWLIAACRKQDLATIRIAPERSDRLPAAILTPRLDLGTGAAARLIVQTLLHCWRAYDELDVWAGPRGVLAPLQNKAEQRRGAKAIEMLDWPDAFLMHLSAEEASKRLGTALHCPALFWPQAGCVIPDAVCEALGRADMHIDCRAGSIRQSKDGWDVLDHDGRTLCSAPSLIVAAGPGSDALLGADMPDMDYRQGQIALLPPTPEPMHALGHRHYITPTIMTASGPARIMGSSFRPVSDPDQCVTAFDPDISHASVAALHTLAPALNLDNATGFWSGLRLVSPDHLPFMGPVINRDWMKTAYANARLDWRRRDLPLMQHKKGLYILSGLGSRGFQTAPLLAQALACHIAGHPMPVEKNQRHALHPARILMRRIIRGENEQQ